MGRGNAAGANRIISYCTPGMYQQECRGCVHETRLVAASNLLRERWPISDRSLSSPVGPGEAGIACKPYATIFQMEAYKSSIFVLDLGLSMRDQTAVSGPICKPMGDGRMVRTNY